MKVIVNKAILILLTLTSLTFGFESEKFTAGIYTEYPLSNGIVAEYDLNNDNFFKARYGYSPEYYMEDLGNILELFDWWNELYSSLLVELCTDMKGLELSFGSKNFLGKDIIANAGVTLYSLNYNNLANDTLNAVLGTDIPSGRDLTIKGKLVALHFNVAKNYQLNERWTLKPGVNLNYINSFYGVIYSDLGINDQISYKLNNWLRDYLEGLILPTVMVELKYQF
jgi:hypothetical protein